MRHRIVIAVLVCVCAIFTGSSSLHAGWTIDGAPVCIAMGDQNYPQILSDGAGGVYIVWNDNRTWTDIYGQHLDDMGRPQWAENGIAVCHAAYSQAHASLCPDGAGGFIAVWGDSREETHWDIYAQRVDSGGNPLWLSTGVAVCTAVDDQQYPKICSDGAGGCIVAWIDERVSSNDDDIYAQRIDADGNMLWAADGVAVGAADSVQENVQIVSDGSGGAVIVWTDLRVETDIYAQKLDSSGSAQWTANGVPVIAVPGKGHYNQKIAPDDAGGAYVTWYDRQSNSSFDIRIQRIGADGILRFISTGLPVCTASEAQRNPSVTADGYGGAIVAWEDFRDGPNDSDVYAKRINSDGSIVWTDTNGELICDTDEYVYNTVILSDAAGGAIVAWEDRRDGLPTLHDVYAQRIDSDGVCLWNANGDSICKADGTQWEIVIASDGFGGAIMAWTDYRNPDDDIFAQRITSGGGFVATAVSYFECVDSDEGPRLEWAVSRECMASDFIVSRRELPNGVFAELAGRPATWDGLEFVFTDDSTEPGARYLYRVDLIEDGDRSLLFETDPVSTPAAELRLHQNVPNPFNPSTRIAWSLDGRCHVRLEIFDAAGRKVTTLLDGVREAGDHEVLWNGTGTDGGQAASGVYLYRLSAGKRTLTRKMILLR